MVLPLLREQELGFDSHLIAFRYGTQNRAEMLRILIEEAENTASGNHGRQGSSSLREFDSLYTKFTDRVRVEPGNDVPDVMSLAKTHQDVVEVGADFADAEIVGIETFVAKLARETIAECSFGELQKGVHIVRPVAEITFLDELSHGRVAADVFNRELIGFQILQSVLDIKNRFCVTGVADHGCEAANGLQVTNLIAMAVQTHVDFSGGEFCVRRSGPAEFLLF
jgi:hypothetical protein